MGHARLLKVSHLLQGHGSIYNTNLVLLQPRTERSHSGELVFDFGVADNAFVLEIDEKLSTRRQSALLENTLVRYV